MESIATRRYMTENSKLNRELSAQRRSNLDSRKKIKKLKVQNQRLGNRLSRVRSLESRNTRIECKTVENFAQLHMLTHASSDAQV